MGLERDGELETKDATRTHIKWYCGRGVFNEVGAVKVERVTALGTRGRVCAGLFPDSCLGWHPKADHISPTVARTILTR